ncbi:MAG: PAS domain S-box protein [Deltaproteobacteria bacterium]|nr:PAS domain S-box protein [Deltaproteobacteria bacterium]
MAAPCGWNCTGYRRNGREERPLLISYAIHPSKNRRRKPSGPAGKKLRLTLEATTEGIWQWNFKTNEMSFSARYYTMLGYEPGAFPASFQAWQNLLHPEDLPKALSSARSYQGTGPDDYANIYRLRTASGDYRWIHSRARVVERDSKGNAVRMIGRHEDITKLKEAEGELQRNEARLRSLVRILQHPSECVQEFLDYTLNEVVDLTESKVGYIYFYNEDRREFVINTWSENVMKECTVAAPPTIYRLEKTGIWGEAVRQRRPILVNDFQAPHPLKKGCPDGHVELFRFLTVPVFREDRIVAVVGVGNKETPYTETDTLQLTLLMDAAWKETDRREAEHVLQDREKTYRAFFESIRDPILVADEERNISDCNPAFCELFGYALDEIKGRKTALIYERKAAYKAMGRSLKESRGTKEIVSNVDFKKKSGETFPGEVKLSYLKDHEGKIVGVVGQIRDLSERVQAEAARSELHAQLLQAQKMESIGRLAGGVAHDFNNKLTVILGYAQMAVEGLDRDDPLYGNLQQVLKAGKQSTDIVRQLLAFARKQTIAPRVIDLNDTLEGMLKMLRRLIGEDIDLSWHPDTNLSLLYMDPSQIDQILANLCVNARDAIQGVGKVTIETENRVLNKSYCADRAGFVPGEYVMLAVSDDGMGMDRETLANAFEPFFTTKEVGKGTGLGLSTVYGIVKQNQGFVNIYSEPGKGTSFKIYLPRHHGKAEKAIEVAQTEIPRGRGETILVVEDDAPVLGLARRVLEKLSYAVLTSASPAEAVAMVREYDGEIHLLMTDVVLPGMSGKDLAGEIMQIRPNISVLFMSGYTADVIARQGVLDEGVHFMGKPFTPDNLARKVREALSSEK